MWQRLISWFKPAKAAEAVQARLDADQPPVLATRFDLAAYRQFMCDETYLYRASYIQKRVDIEGASNYTDALAKGSVIVVFVHHGSWLLMNGALHHLCGGAPSTSIASRRNLEFCTPEEKEFWLGVHRWYLPPLNTTLKHSVICLPCIRPLSLPHAHPKSLRKLHWTA